MTVEVQQDGLTYVLTITEPCGPGKAEALLSEDPDSGWRMQDVGGNWVVRIGKRKRWQQALCDALIILEQRERDRR